MIVHEPAMNWQMEKRYFPSFKPLVYILRVYSTKSFPDIIGLESLLGCLLSSLGLH